MVPDRHGGNSQYNLMAHFIDVLTLHRRDEPLERLLINFFSNHFQDATPNITLCLDAESPQLFPLKNILVPLTSLLRLSCPTNWINDSRLSSSVGSVAFAINYF